MKKHVLLAEDDTTVRCMLDEILHFLGYKVTMATNGLEALARMDEADTAVDVVLTDHQMPVLDGLGLTRALRVRAYAGRIYVLSGSMAAKAREEYLRLQVNGIAMKPLEIDALHRLLTQE